MQAPKEKSLDIIQKETRTAALFIHMIAQSMNLQFTDIRCLHYLMTHEVATAGKIAEITNLTTGAVTAMIDRLEKANFLKRHLDEDDRRKTIIKLEADVFHKTPLATTFFSKDVQKLLSDFSSKEQEVIITWNKQMTQLLQEKLSDLQK